METRGTPSDVYRDAKSILFRHYGHALFTTDLTKDTPSSKIMREYGDTPGRVTKIERVRAKSFSAERETRWSRGRGIETEKKADDNETCQNLRVYFFFFAS